MTKRTSRYASCPPFQIDPRTTFKGHMPRAIPRTAGLVEHRVVSGDRMDRLGLTYFADDRLWWRISDANNGFLFAQDAVFDQSPESAPDSLKRRGMTGLRILVPGKE